MHHLYILPVVETMPRSFQTAVQLFIALVRRNFASDQLSVAGQLFQPAALDSDFFPQQFDLIQKVDVQHGLIVQLFVTL